MRPSRLCAVLDGVACQNPGTERAPLSDVLCTSGCNGNTASGEERVKREASRRGVESGKEEDGGMKARPQRESINQV